MAMSRYMFSFHFGILILTTFETCYWHTRNTIVSGFSFHAFQVTPNRRYLFERQTGRGTLSSGSAFMVPKDNDLSKDYYSPTVSSPGASVLTIQNDTMTSLPVESGKDRRTRLWIEKRRKHDYHQRFSAEKKIPRELPKIDDLLKAYAEEVGLASSTVKLQKNTDKPLTPNRSTQYKRLIDQNNSMARVVPSTSKKIPEVESNDSQIKTEPWKADFKTSTRTQSRLKTAAAVPFSVSEKTNDGRRTYQNRHQIVAATNIIVTLLNTDPTTCNEVNVLYALSQSAKIYPPLNNSRGVTTRGDEKALRDIFLSNLVKLLDVFTELLSNGELSGRHLSNAAWAIVRHLKNSSIDLKYGGANEVPIQDRIPTELKEKSTILLQRIAVELDRHIMLLPQKLKAEELCMVAWAYATLKPRDRPTGWEFPPRETRVPDHVLNYNNDRFDRENMSDVITFERSDEFYDFYKNDDLESNLNDKNDHDEIDTLFISIFNVFLQGETMCETFTNRTTKEQRNNDSEVLLQECTWKELSNLAWACASHGHHTVTSEEFMMALATEATRRIRNNTIMPQPRDVSLMSWSLGVFQVQNFRLGDHFVTFVDAVSESMLNFSPHDSSMDRTSDNVSTALSASSANNQPFQEWQCADIVQFAVSLAHARLDRTVVLCSLFTEALSKIANFQSWELSVLLWVQARLYLTGQQGHIFEAFSAAITHELLVRMEKSVKVPLSDGIGDNYRDNVFPLARIGIGAQEQANLAWSLTVLEIYSPESITLLQEIFSTASHGTTTTNNTDANAMIKLEHAHQLHQALFILQHDCPKAVNHVPPSFAAFLDDQWKQEKCRRKISSARHRALSQTLKLMGVAHYNEHDEDIDVAIVLKDATSWTHTAEVGEEGASAAVASSASYSSLSRFGDSDGDSLKKKQGHSNKLSTAKHRVAVEFDGPDHFTRGTTKPRALGHAVLKYKLLKRQGWTVVRVPYYEFDKIPFWASMERQRYLQRILKTHDNIRFSSVDVSEYQAIVANRQSRFD